jgi:hypothetical protein
LEEMRRPQMQLGEIKGPHTARIIDIHCDTNC